MNLPDTENQADETGGICEKIAKDFTDGCRKIFGANLRGVYLHGSAAMGCFNPRKSDLDFIAVVENPLTDNERLDFLAMVLALDSSADAPAKGLELSVVLRSVCENFRYPTPFEFHFSRAHKKWAEDAPLDFIEKMRGTDKDLAAHFVIIKNRGKCLFGEPATIFGQVPQSAFFDSILCDCLDGADEITENPVYYALNMARALAFKNDGLVLSKKEGAQWAMQNLPKEHALVAENALADYESGGKTEQNPDTLKKYAAYMIARIQGAAQAGAE